MYRALRIGIIFVFGFMLIACSITLSLDKMEAPDRGMIYGNMQVPGGIRGLEVQKLDKDYSLSDDSVPWVRIFRNGNFIIENLKPGKYTITRVVTYKKRYNLMRDKKAEYHPIINIGTNTVVYAGSFVIEHKTDGFTFKRVAMPSEKKILKHIKNLSRGTNWMAKITDRLEQLI